MVAEYISLMYFLFPVPGHSPQNVFDHFFHVAIMQLNLITASNYFPILGSLPAQ